MRCVRPLVAGTESLSTLRVLRPSFESQVEQNKHHSNQNKNKTDNDNKTRWCSTINRADSTHVDITEDRKKSKTKQIIRETESTKFQNHMDMGSSFATYRLCEICKYVSKAKCLGAIGIQQILVGMIF